MNKLLTFVALVLLSSCATDSDVARWEERAQGVTIIRDDWGIPHISGDTDADAVFGLMYAQAEDDFNRIEVNFLNSQGRLAEAEGEGEIWRDLRMKLFIDPEEMKAMYAQSPAWLRDLMDAWADGLNYYLHTHPEVTPRVITRFEPWMALTFSEGSIGGDIERVSLRGLEDLYGDTDRQATAYLEDTPDLATVGDARLFAEPTGSNGIAVAPANTVGGDALLLINPHTAFSFRAEVHVTSGEGLNAYGAVTGGQFFVYQGVNETAGWMHTSSGVDNIDEYLETIVEREDGLHYLYGDEERRLVTREITVPYRTDAGLAERVFTVYETHRGPIVRATDDRWVSVRLMEEPLKALQQSYSRTKAANLDEFTETMRLHTNSSNNTLFADAAGNIAYFHSNFIPVRDPAFDYTQPVDGSNPAVDWQGIHSVEESPNMINPANGWVQNTNNWPFSVSGPLSPRPEDYPAYVQRGGENYRGEHAIMLLQDRSDFTLDGLARAAYDGYIPAFAAMVPELVQSYDRMATSVPLDTDLFKLTEPIELLRDWDFRWGVGSVPTALAVFWGRELMRLAREGARASGGSPDTADGVPDELRVAAFAAAVDRLEEDFGTWRTPWGEINRFQRLTGDIVQPHDDEAPSIPVGFVSGRWGSLASFGAGPHNGSKKFYGTSGNSFVAVVEFGDSVRARAVTAGGLSSDPANPHFDDQAERYATGDLRSVYFYPDQLEGHTEREYHPGG
ncbi:MAG: penicillin acylase family protein [Gemmatimonadota bacterium]